MNKELFTNKATNAEFSIKLKNYFIKYPFRRLNTIKLNFPHIDLFSLICSLMFDGVLSLH